MKSRFYVTRKWLIFWTFFIGIGAVVGSTAMFLAPDGSILQMQDMLKDFQVLPFADVLFQNYIFPGIALLIVNGITNLTAGILLIRKKKLGVILGGIFGVTLMMWITIQFIIFPLNALSVSYFIFGICQAATGLMAWIFLKQETFAKEEEKRLSKYLNLDKNAGENNNVNETHKKTLVVFFSRMGYTRKYAYNLKEELDADIYEVKATEHTQGTSGFWWCGRFGMHGWPMDIEEISVPLEEYEKVVICTPIWVFRICGPIRSFCMKASGKIKAVDYVLVHFQPSAYESAFKEMDSLLGINYEKATSICSQQGHEVKRYEF